MLPDLITKKIPPQKRINKTDGEFERVMPEAAIMLAFAFYIFQQNGNIGEVKIHPDGEHIKQFDIRNWLEQNGFEKRGNLGKTAYGGVYVRANITIRVFPKSGVADVSGFIGDSRIVAECKGGVINTKHSGQQSKLRRGLCEAVAILLARPLASERQVAVAPKTAVTSRLAKAIAHRANRAGIEIALIDEFGDIDFIASQV